MDFGCLCVWESPPPPAPCCLWEGVKSDGRYGERWASDDIALCSPPLDMTHSILHLSIMRLRSSPTCFLLRSQAGICRTCASLISVAAHIHVTLIHVKPRVYFVVPAAFLVHAHVQYVGLLFILFKWLLEARMIDAWARRKRLPFTRLISTQKELSLSAFSDPDLFPFKYVCVCVCVSCHLFPVLCTSPESQGEPLIWSAGDSCSVKSPQPDLVNERAGLNHCYYTHFF